MFSMDGFLASPTGSGKSSRTATDGKTKLDLTKK
jgi:hypothetical protein